MQRRQEQGLGKNVPCRANHAAHCGAEIVREESMQPSEYHYLPLTPAFFSLLVAAFVVLVVLVQIGVLRYAYMRLGVGPGVAMLLLFASLVGSYFNIPVAELPGNSVVSGQVVDFFGMRYVVPMMLRTPGALIVVNVGGAVIPTLMSLYLLGRYDLWAKGAGATTIVSAVIHWFATPVPGLGIAVPVFMPALVTAFAAFLLARDRAAPLAYIAGSLGTLIGADLLNLGRIGDLGAPIASIGGAGTFDGIFLTGILAVLIASLAGPPARPAAV
jgi:uncharacterized membrane protein